jgi:plasmid stabilization system protein ParE
MDRKIIRRPLAEQGIMDEARFIAKDDVEAAVRFLSRVEDSLRFLATWPESGDRIAEDDPQLKGVRIWQVKDFENHLIVFRSGADVIEVLHVFHGSRKIASVLRDIQSQR